MNKKKIIGYLIPFLTGMIGVIIIALFMYFVTLDLRYMAVLSIISFFGLALNLARRGYTWFRSIALMSIVPSVFFYLILGEIPGLYFIIPVVIASIAIAQSLHKMEKKWSVLAISFVLGCTAYSFITIPKIVQSQLVKVVNQQAPAFTFTSMDGEVLTNDSLKGDVVILDFFGTWCKPCIQELKDFKEIEAELKSIKFYVISTDQSGDTEDKVRAFISKWMFDYNFGYDQGGKAHSSFGFTGVPALVILDKSGNIRMKHQGYNVSENLTELIGEKIKELLGEY